MRATRAAMFAAVCVALGALGHSYMSGADVPLVGLLGAFGVTGVLAWLAAGHRRGPVGITAALLTVQGALHLAFSAGQAAATRSTAGPGPGPGPAPMPHGHHHTPTGAPGTAHGHAATHAAGTPPTPDPGAAPGTATVPPAPAHAHAGAADLTHAPGAAADLTQVSGGAGPRGVPGAADLAHLPGAAGLADVPGAADLADMAEMAGMAGHGGFGMLAAHVLAGLFCALWLARGEAAVFRLARAVRAAARHAARPLAHACVLVRARVAHAPAPAVFPAPCERPRRLRGAVHAHTAVRRGPPGGRALRVTAPGRPARA